MIANFHVDIVVSFPYMILAGTALSFVGLDCDRLLSVGVCSSRERKISRPSSWRQGSFTR